MLRTAFVPASFFSSLPFLLLLFSFISCSLSISFLVVLVVEERVVVVAVVFGFVGKTQTTVTACAWCAILCQLNENARVTSSKVG